MLSVYQYKWLFTCWIIVTDTLMGSTLETYNNNVIYTFNNAVHGLIYLWHVNL